MEYLIICKYCDHRWRKTAIYPPSVKSNIKCSRCSDKNFRVVEISSTRIDTYVEYKPDRIDAYAGCPPFPEDEKQQKEQEVTFDYSNLYDYY